MLTESAFYIVLPLDIVKIIDMTDIKRPNIIYFVILLLSGFVFADQIRFEHPGGLHTAVQIDNIRNKMSDEPVKKACDVLFSTAQTLLEYEPNPPADFKVPYYYMNKKACMKAKSSLSDDAFAAYTLALAGQISEAETADKYTASAIRILNAWAATNKEISGFDGNLIACYCGVPLVLAAELVNENPLWKETDKQIFRQWLSNTLAKSANSIKRKKNNHGCWGLYTSLACNYFLEDTEGFESDINLLKKQISAMIADSGELPSENKRTNSGMWYTYFALCPMSCSAAIVTNATGEDMFNYTDAKRRGLKPALDKLFEYSISPQSWPYEKPTGLTGAIHNLFNPSSDKVKMPRPDSWPANLYEVMIPLYNGQDWDNWLKSHRPIQSGRGWCWATISAAQWDNQ
ncbi:MAG: alginate lyase family protein [Sedimentisphaeraceae bacterium JB056]